MDRDLSESMTVSLFITEPEDISLLKSIGRKIEGFNQTVSIISITNSPNCKNCWDVVVMVESPTALYLLGRFVGVDRKRLHDLDF
jgi:hypothetical protein